MRILNVVAALLMVSFFLLSNEGKADHVRNGGGTAERNFAFALSNFNSYIDLALAVDISKFTPSERLILQEIKISLAVETANTELLQFHSEAEEPGFFILDGAVRVAKTGSNIGDAIYLNRDLLYPLRDGKWNAMGISECVAILIHEFGHHHGETSHTTLDLIGTKVQSLLEKKMTNNEFDPALSVSGDDLSSIKQFPVLTSVDFSPDLQKEFNSRFYLSDSFGTYDVTPNLIAGIQNVGDQEGANANRLNGKSCWGSDFDRSERTGWKFRQFHLGSPRWTYATTIKPGVYLFIVKAALSVDCVSQTGQRFVDPGLDALHLVILETEGGMSRLKFLDEKELQKTMTLVHDDDDYKLAAIMRVVFQAMYEQ